MTVRIAVVGAGRVGRALAAGLTRAGHEVVLAVRDPQTRTGLPVPVVPVAGAAEGVDVVVLAVPFRAVGDAVGELSPPVGTVLVDATNPFGQALPPGAASGAAHVAELAPQSRVVKAFNVLGAETMGGPAPRGPVRALLPVAGDDAEARALVARLAEDLGHEAVEVGGLEAAALLEEAARYWGLLAFGGGLGRNFALGAVRS